MSTIELTPYQMVAEYNAIVNPNGMDPDLYASLMLEEYNELLEALDEGGDHAHILKEAMDYIYVSMGFLQALRWSEDDCKDCGELHDFSVADSIVVLFRRVVQIEDLCYDSGWNLSEAFKRVHENNMGRMKQPNGKIKYNSKGKVMKNKEYPKVDLSDLVS